MGFFRKLFARKKEPEKIRDGTIVHTVKFSDKVADPNVYVHGKDPNGFDMLVKDRRQDSLSPRAQKKLMRRGEASLPSPEMYTGSIKNRRKN